MGYEKWKWKSRLTLCDPMVYIVHGILQARILEWVAFPFLQGINLPNPGIDPRSPALQANFFTSWATPEAQEHWSG